jgi:hypothetical protein
MLRQQRSHEIRSSWCGKNKFFFALYTNLKTRQMNSSNAVGKTGHKWKTAYFKCSFGECCSLCFRGRSERSWPMNNLADWRKGLQCRRGTNCRKFLSLPPPPPGPPMCYHYRCTRDSLPAFRLNISGAKIKKRTIFMRLFSVMSCGFLHSYSTVRLPDRLSPVQNLTPRPKSKPIDFPHNDVNSTSSGSLDQDVRNTICQTWFPKVLKTILTSL